MNNYSVESFIEKVKIALLFHNIYCVAKITFYIVLIILLIIACCELHSITEVLTHFGLHYFDCCRYVD